MFDAPVTPGHMLRLTVAANAIQVPGAPNALAGRLIEELGYAAIYISRASLAAGQLATGDECVLTLTELAQQLRYLSSRVTTPIIVDGGDCGGGDANVRRTVTELESAGAAAVALGDHCGTRGGDALIANAEMATKLRTASESRVDGQCVLIAKTSARATEGLDAAIGRARSYLDAGAEWIFPDGLETREEYAAFAEAVLTARTAPEVRLVAAMAEFGPAPLLTLDELTAIGYSVVLYPETLLRVAMKAMESTLSILAVDGTQRDVVDLMLTRDELENLMRDD